MILEPIRGMRTSHCSKTYQLGPLPSANSACFRHFLRLITGFAGFSVPDSATSGRSLTQFPSRRCHALSLDAGFRGTVSQLMCGSAGTVSQVDVGGGGLAGREWEGPSGRGLQVGGGPPGSAIMCGSVGGSRLPGGSPVRTAVLVRGLNVGGPNRGGWGLDQCVSGGDLLSHTLPGAVPSALWVLASGFGMGPGVSPTL
jgi:hypothetical protein